MVEMLLVEEKNAIWNIKRFVARQDKAQQYGDFCNSGLELQSLLLVIEFLNPD